MSEFWQVLFVQLLNHTPGNIELFIPFEPYFGRDATCLDQNMQDSSNRILWRDKILIQNTTMEVTCNSEGNFWTSDVVFEPNSKFCLDNNMFALNLHNFGVHLYIFFQIAYPFKLKASGWHHVWICLGTSLPSVHSAWSSWSWMTSTSTHAPVDIRWNHLYNIPSSDELCCSWIPNMWATVRYCGLCSIASQINLKCRQADNSSQTSWQSCNGALMWERGD